MPNIVFAPVWEPDASALVAVAVRVSPTSSTSNTELEAVIIERSFNRMPWTSRLGNISQKAQVDDPRQRTSHSSDDIIYPDDATDQKP